MAASEQDFVKGVDMTGIPSASAADFNQLVDTGYPAADKGLVVVTTDVGGVPDAPDAATTTKWKRYLWLRLMPASTSFALYAWNPSQLSNINYSSGVGFITTYWNNITLSAIPADSIEGYMIKNTTITKEKIVSIDISQVEGFSPANYVTKAGEPHADGDIGGNYNDGLIIKNGKVLTVMVADDAITTAKILGNNVTLAKIVNGTGKYILQMNDAGTALAYIRNYFAELQTLGTAGQLAVVNAGATALEWKSPSDSIVKIFEPAAIALTAGDQVLDFGAHSLGGQPHSVEVFLKVTATGAAAGLGYAEGDLISADTVANDTDGREKQVFCVWLPVAGTSIKVLKTGGPVHFSLATGEDVAPITNVSDATFVTYFTLAVKAMRVQ